MSNTTPIEPNRFMLATTAIHQLGDISRDKPDLCIVGEETEADYIGNWVTGLGFLNVHFPKSTTRPLTKDEEIQYHLRLPDMPVRARLEKWAIVCSDDPYKAPELWVSRLTGEIYGHPNFTDGEVVTTSRIIGRRGDEVATRNTLYTLGEIDPEYEEVFPGAKARLLASLSEV